MAIQSAYSENPKTEAAVQDAFACLCEKLRGTPDLVIIAHGAVHTTEALAQAVKALPDGVRVFGGGACGGLMTEEQVLTGDAVLGMLGLRVPGLQVGIAAASQDQDMYATVQQTVQRALADVGRSGEIPDAVVFLSTPGSEETILTGLKDIFGPHVPFYGAGACSNLETLQSGIIGNSQVYERGLAVAVIFGDGLKSMSFHSGFVPSAHSGRVTALDGPRCILEIDGQPASTVYSNWYRAQFGAEFPHGDAMQDGLTLAPLGRSVGKLDHLELFALTAIADRTKEGGLRVLTDMAVGQDIRMMLGMRATMAARPARAINTAIDLQKFQRIDGALVAFCAFLARFLRDDLAAVHKNMCVSMMGRPFMLVFSCGEQGVMQNNQVVNGNLMVSAMVFGT